jgi:hypothetical protein
MLWTFDNIKTEMKDRLSLLSNWANTLYYGVYERIIDVIAYIIDKLIYIIEFYYRESSWSLAQRFESLATRCLLLSYNYHRKIGAVGNLLLSSDSNFSSSYVNTLNDVSVSRWTHFKNTTGTSNVFCTETTNYVRNTIGNQTIPVKEGIPRSYLYAAQGIANEVISLFPTNVTYGIDNDDVDVFITQSDGTILYEVTVADNLYYIDDLTAYYCTVKNVPDFSKVLITFGDGVYAPKLSAGQYVLIKYADTLGDQGNIQSLNVINTIESTLYDVYGTDVTSQLYVKNNEAISDGLDFEDIESVRNNAPALFQAGFRCGSLADWKSIIDNVSYVYNSALWTINDVGGSTLASELNTVYITGVSNSGDDLTLAQQTDIELNYLREKKSPTETITWQALEKVYAFFDVNAKINNLTSDVVTTQIKDAVDAEYGTLNTNFQTNIYESAYNSVINSVPTIVYHNTDLYHMEKNVPKTATNETIIPSYVGTDTAVLEDQVFLTSNSIKIWYKQKLANAWSTIKQIGASSGTIIYSYMPSSFTITGGTINYANNQYSYTIAGSGLVPDIPNPGSTDPDGYLLYLSYQTKDGNGLMNNCIRLPKKYQITDVDEDFVFTTISYI